MQIFVIPFGGQFRMIRDLDYTRLVVVSVRIENTVIKKRESEFIQLYRYHW